MKMYASIIIASLGCLVCGNAAAQREAPPPATPQLRPSLLDVVRLYTSSGSMGDGTNGTKYVQIDDSCNSNTRPKRKTCVKITYSIGPMTWAGIYWLNKPDNWGDKPGEDFSSKGFKRISFWARGERGNEVVEFKAGGISSTNKLHKDSFEVTLGKVTLEKDWSKHELSIEGQNVSSVIGLFCWSASVTSNPNGLIFYLDEIQYE